MMNYGQPTPDQFAQRNMGNAPNYAAGLRQDPNIAQYAGAPEGAPTSLSEDQRAYIRSLPPEQQAEAVRKLTQDYAGKGGMATQAMQKAQAGMDAQAPEGRQAGRVYVAANPLEHLATGMRKYNAKKDYDSALGEKKKLSDEYGGSLADSFKASLYK